MQEGAQESANQAHAGTASGEEVQAHVGTLVKIAVYLIHRATVQPVPVMML
jgi:hypothetical protein